MSEVRITDEMVGAATKAIILQMQCYDFGHVQQDGNFVTTEAKISLLKVKAREAARAALSAALSGMAEPTALKRAVNNLVSVALDYGRDFNDADSDERILLNAKFEAATEDVNAFFSAPPASEREENARLRKALNEITDMANWQIGVPTDTEASNEHARIAQAMSETARAALQTEGK